jgi:hypothetical protein
MLLPLGVGGLNIPDCGFGSWLPGNQGERNMEPRPPRESGKALRYPLRGVWGQQSRPYPTRAVSALAGSPYCHSRQELTPPYLDASPAAPAESGCHSDKTVSPDNILLFPQGRSPY